MRMTSRRTRPILTRTLALVALCALPAVVTAQVERPEQIEYPELPEFDVPEPTRIELDNGMVLILIEDHELPLITSSPESAPGSGSTRRRGRGWPA